MLLFTAVATSINERKRKIRQTTTVQAPLYAGGVKATIETEAILDRQYTAYSLNFQPLQYLQKVFTSTADELTREYGADIYERIAEDAMAAGILNDIVMGVVTQPPVAVATSDAPEALAMERFINYQLTLLHVRSGFSLVALLRQMLRTALVWGNSVAELVFAAEPSSNAFEVEPLTASFFTLRKVVPVLPTRYSFALSSEGDVVGITPLQVNTSAPMVYSTGEGRIKDPTVIPMLKVLYVVYGRKGLDPTGESFLVPAFKSWAMKKEVEEHMMLLAKRIRKSWLGVLPPDAQTVCITDPETGEQEYIRPKEDLLAVLQALANGEGGVVPHGTTIEAYDVEVAGAAQYFLELYKQLNREILRALYSRMLANNNDAAASTTGEFDRDMVAKTVRAMRAWFEDALMQLSYNLVALNFGTEMATFFAPRIAVGRGDGMPLTLRDVAVLHQAGWFTREQKNEIDELFGIPTDYEGEVMKNGDGEGGDARAEGRAEQVQAISD